MGHSTALDDHSVHITWPSSLDLLAGEFAADTTNAFSREGQSISLLLIETDGHQLVLRNVFNGVLRAGGTKHRRSSGTRRRKRRRGSGTLLIVDQSRPILRTNSSLTTPRDLRNLRGHSDESYKDIRRGTSRSS